MDARDQCEDGVVTDDVATRADRLGVHVLMFGLVREEPRNAVRSLAVVPLLMPEEIGMFCTRDDEDLALSNACLEVEAALRDREWAALERLLGLVAAGEGPLVERVERLPDWAFRRRPALCTSSAGCASSTPRLAAGNAGPPADANPVLLLNVITLAAGSRLCSPTARRSLLRTDRRRSSRSTRSD